MLAAIVVGILLLFGLVGGVAFLAGGVRALWLHAKTGNAAAAAAFWFLVASMALALFVLFLAVVIE